MAPVFDSLLLNVGILLTVAAASMTVSLLMSRRIVANVRRLGEHADRLGGGDTEHPLSPSGIREFRQLGEALNRMAADLRHASEHTNQALDLARWQVRFPQENPNPVLRIASDGTLLYSNESAATCGLWRCTRAWPSSRS